MSKHMRGPYSWVEIAGDYIAFTPVRGSIFAVRIEHAAAASELLTASRAAWHALQSLLAQREAPTDDLLRGVAEALETAIAKAEDDS